MCEIFPHTCPSPLYPGQPLALYNLAHLLATTLMHRSTLDALKTPLNRPLNAT